MAYIGLSAGDPRAPPYEGADSYSRSPRAFYKSYGPYSGTSGMSVHEAYEAGPMSPSWPYEESVETMEARESSECARSDWIDPAVKPYTCPLNLYRDSHKGLFFNRDLVKHLNLQNTYLMNEDIRDPSVVDRFKLDPRFSFVTRSEETWGTASQKPKPGPTAGPMRIARPLGPLSDVEAQRGSLDSFESRDSRFAKFPAKPSFHFGYDKVVV
jgi:hypothetical protein